MTNNIIYREFKPTYLYIKQHSITGKFYFGKTIQDPKKYKGSGLHWTRHLKVHGRKNVVTLWYELYTNKESLMEFALQFSKDMNIVESNQWLNMKVENGLDGALSGEDNHNYGKVSPLKGIHLSIERRAKIGEQSKGRIPNEDTRKLMSIARSGENHHFYGLKGEDNPNFGKVRTEEARANMRASARRGEDHEWFGKPGNNLGKTFSDEWCENISKSKMGKKQTDIQKLNTSIACKGINQGPQDIVICPECNKSGGMSNMKRYHFDNCKSKDVNVK